MAKFNLKNTKKDANASFFVVLNLIKNNKVYIKNQKTILFFLSSQITFSRNLYSISL